MTAIRELALGMALSDARLRSMQMSDVAAVLAIENAVYPHPWSEGNFTDSLACGYDALVLVLPDQTLVGYFLLMPVVDEFHLLNIAVRADLQAQGWGRVLLNAVVDLARTRKMQSILLEVRPSNTRALAIYAHDGFVTIGRRKAYYPAAEGGREDAIVMRLTL